jgi:peptide chain release factor 2
MPKLIIPRSDLRRETFHCGGHGGQNVNKTETGVRWVYIPTGISAEGRSERSQLQNSESAYAVLMAKLWRLVQDRIKGREQDRYAAKPNASFGNQIRTYRDVGERDVVDHRTGIVGTFDAVVRRGKIDEFIEANLKQRTT